MSAADDLTTEKNSAEETDEITEKAEAQRYFQGVDLDNVNWVVTVTRIQPPMWEFPDLSPVPIPIGGWVGEIENDIEMLTPKAIANVYGGTKYQLQLFIPSKRKGVIKSETVRVGSAPPKPPTEWQIARLEAKGKFKRRGGMNGNGTELSGAEATLAGMSIKSADTRAADDRKRSDRREDYMRGLEKQLSDERIERAKETSRFESSLARLEQRMEGLTDGRTAEIESAKIHSHHDVSMAEVMSKSMDRQADIHQRQLEASDRDGKEVASAMSSSTDGFFKTIQAMQAKERETERASSERMMTLIDKQNESALKILQAGNDNALALRDAQLTMMREEMRDMKKDGRKGMGDHIKEIATIFGALKELGLNVGGADAPAEDKWMQVLDKLGENAEYIPAILQSAGSAISNAVHGPRQGAPAAQGAYSGQLQQPGQPGAPEQPGQPEQELTPEQQAEVAMAQQMEMLLDIVVLGQQQNKPARDIAGYIMNKHEQAAMLLVPAETEGLVGEIIKRRPALGTASGTKFIREVHTALQGMVN